MSLPLGIFTLMLATVVSPVSGPIEEAAKRHNFKWFGLTVAEAELKAAKEDLEFRVVKADGKYLPKTKEFRRGRINAHIFGNKVVAVEIEGLSHSIVEGVIELSHLSYLGLNEKDAVERAELNRLPFRVVIRNGKSNPVTMDYIKNRANAVVINDKVVAITKG